MIKINCYEDLKRYIQPITKQVYIENFNSKTNLINNVILEKFLDDIITTTEDLNEIFKANNITPNKILSDLKQKFDFDNNLLDSIEQFSKSSKIKDLQAIEIFVFIWYCSCRNVMTFDNSTYTRMANNGTIGRLLNQLVLF